MKGRYINIMKMMKMRWMKKCNAKLAKAHFFIFIATCNVMQGWDDHAMYHEVGEQLICRVEVV
jgi:hypothetical protein